MTRFINSSPNDGKKVSAVKGAKPTEQSIYKKPPTSPTMKSFKNYSAEQKGHQFYLSLLKTMLPHGQDGLSELEVVERTIEYIKYLEKIVDGNNKQEITISLQRLSVD